MDLHLQNKVVVVTGASAGIGRAVAMEFAKEGCALAICGRSAQRLDDARAELEQLGAKVFTGQLDVADSPALHRFSEEVKAQLGPVDIWVSNAAVNLSKPWLECTLDDWDLIFNTNLKSVFYGGQLAAKQMIAAQNKGVIVNVSSFAATIPATAQPLYGAAKGAMNVLTRSMAAECAPYGIRVVGVAPGWTRTERGMLSAQDVDMKQILSEISLQRMAESEEIAKPLVFLASEACSYVTGTTMDVTGGKFSVQRPGGAWPQN